VDSACKLRHGVAIGMWPDLVVLQHVHALTVSEIVAASRAQMAMFNRGSGIEEQALAIGESGRFCFSTLLPLMLSAKHLANRIS
jgi:hypothetical protein